MAKSRGRGRLPLPRTREFFYTGSKEDERQYQTFFALFHRMFRSSKMLRVNEAVNAARYMLNLLDIDADTAIEYNGTGYDYEVFVTIGQTTLQVQQGRELAEAA